MDIDLLNEKVLGAVRQNLGCDDPDDESLDDRIREMGERETFSRFLEWEGIVNYADRIWNAVENIKQAARAKEDTDT